MFSLILVPVLLILTCNSVVLVILLVWSECERAFEISLRLVSRLH